MSKNVSLIFFLLYYFIFFFLVPLISSPLYRFRDSGCLCTLFIHYEHVCECVYMPASSGSGVCVCVWGICVCIHCRCVAAAAHILFGTCIFYVAFKKCKKMEICAFHALIYAVCNFDILVWG